MRKAVIKEQIKARHGSETELWKAQELELQAQIERMKVDSSQVSVKIAWVTNLHLRNLCSRLTH